MSLAPPPTHALRESAERVRAKETLWRLTALCVCHPAPEFHGALVSGAFHAAFAGAWAKVTGRGWPGAAVCEDFERFEAGYITAFLHGANGKPLASLLAGDHDALLRGLSRPVFMLNLAGFYRHFGLGPATGDEGRHDEPDHLAAMLEFIAVLCHLEATALARGRDPAPTRRAQRDFLCRYLSPALACVCSHLARRQVPDLDPTLNRVLQDIERWSQDESAALEARVGPFRDPDAPSPATTPLEPAEQNLWG